MMKPLPSITCNTCQASEQPFCRVKIWWENKYYLLNQRELTITYTVTVGLQSAPEGHFPRVQGKDEERKNPSLALGCRLAVELSQVVSPVSWRSWKAPTHSPFWGPMWWITPTGDAFSLSCSACPNSQSTLRTPTESKSRYPQGRYCTGRLSDSLENSKSPCFFSLWSSPPELVIQAVFTARGEKWAPLGLSPQLSVAIWKAAKQLFQASAGFRVKWGYSKSLRASQANKIVCQPCTAQPVHLNRGLPTEKSLLQTVYRLSPPSLHAFSMSHWKILLFYVSADCHLPFANNSSYNL